MRARLVAVALAAALLAVPPPAQPAVSAKSPTQAEALFAQAEASFAALRADARAQRQRQNFARVLEAYRRVFEKHPATRQGELALIRAGELLTLLYRWTGQEGDLNRAQNYYQRLIQTAPKSPLLDDALLAIAYIHLDQFKDPAQAWLRFRDVVVLAPGGDKVAEAKRQLKRLQRYAVAEPAARAEGTGDVACPPSRPAAAAAAAAAAPAQQPPPGAAPSPVPAPAAPPAAPPGMPTVLNRIRDIRHWSNPEYSRVVIDLDQKTNFYSNLLEDRSGSGKPPRLYVDLFSSLVEERFCRPIDVNDGILLGVRAGQYTPDSVRVVLDIDRLRTYRVFPMYNPFRIVVDVTGGESAAPSVSGPPPPPPAAEPSATARAIALAPPPALAPLAVPELLPLPPLSTPDGQRDTAPAAAAPVAAPAGGPNEGSSPPAGGTVPAGGPAAAAATPAASTVQTADSGAGSPPPPTALPPRAQRGREARTPPPAPSAKLSLARQLGLGVRRVVIDAGHGAHDPGAIGVGGLQEKDVTLDVALRVRDTLQAAGYQTVLTRDRDVYLPLEERTALANTARGDLFLSIHCNSSDAGNLSGVETYWLNLASGRRAIATAARENSMALANMSDLQDLLKEIYNSKMDESSQFAAAVQRSLHGALRRKFRDTVDLGVKQAPFYVLIGAQMPSILAEVSFINHRTEGRRLADPLYRQLIAQAIADGVKRYVRTVKTAALDTGRSASP